MPAVIEWNNFPTQIINRLILTDIENFRGNCHAAVHQYFANKLASESNALYMIPSLNDVPAYNLENETLVHLRCMVQSMSDPEYFLGLYAVENVKTGENVLRTSMYRDLTDCGSDEHILLDSASNITMERLTLYCVPIPGENAWVKEEYARKGRKYPMNSMSNEVSRNKRRVEENEVSMQQDFSTVSDEKMALESNGPETECQNKRLKTAASQENGIQNKKSLFDFNFPLPGENGPACFVKIYDQMDSYKVNDVVEFIGVLSYDITSPESGDQGNTPSTATIDVDDLRAEDHASFIPRLHVITANKLPHSNPLLPAITNTGDLSLLSQVSVLREQIIAILQQALCGDKLAAEYLLCNLVSSVYTRHDIVSLGKFSVNLIGCPGGTLFVKFLYDMLAQLVTKSFLLHLTIDNLNTLNFTPKKNYETNRLESGILQLSERTHFVINELSLQPGQLNTKGVENITALGNAITWQMVNYDFQYHQQGFPADLAVVVLSEGKSLLKCDCQLLVEAQDNVPDLTKRFEAIQLYLTPDLLNQLRKYLDLCRLLPYSLTEQLQKSIEEDFVRTRQEDSSNMSTDDFHLLLTLARLLTISEGRTVLSEEDWIKARDMELSRKQRLCKLPSSTGSNN